MKVHIYYLIFLPAYGMELELMKSGIVEFTFFWVERQEISPAEAETAQKLRKTNEPSQYLIT